MQAAAAGCGTGVYGERCQQHLSVYLLVQAAVCNDLCSVPSHVKHPDIDPMIVFGLQSGRPALQQSRPRFSGCGQSSTTL